VAARLRFGWTSVAAVEESDSDPTPVRLSAPRRQAAVLLGAVGNPVPCAWLFLSPVRNLRSI
jgi:hypothetical protein